MKKQRRKRERSRGTEFFMGQEERKTTKNKKGKRFLMSKKQKKQKRGLFLCVKNCKTRDLPKKRLIFVVFETHNNTRPFVLSLYSLKQIKQKTNCLVFTIKMPFLVCFFACFWLCWTKNARISNRRGNVVQKAHKKRVIVPIFYPNKTLGFVFFCFLAFFLFLFVEISTFAQSGAQSFLPFFPFDIVFFFPSEPFNHKTSQSHKCKCFLVKKLLC